jgi:hypothetical protein
MSINLAIELFGPSRTRDRKSKRPLPTVPARLRGPYSFPRPRLIVIHDDWAAQSIRSGTTKRLEIRLARECPTTTRRCIGTSAEVAADRFSSKVSIPPILTAPCTPEVTVTAKLTMAYKYLSLTSRVSAHVHADTPS